jgi:hypothetical protein
MVKKKIDREKTGFAALGLMQFTETYRSHIYIAMVSVKRILPMGFAH